MTELVTRAAWGATARGATPRTHPIGSTEGVSLHWEGPGMGGFPHSQCARKVRSIQRFHKFNRGWADIAYNAVVCPHGYVYEGRGPWVTSAANGYTSANAAWYAVCYLGGVGDPLTEDGKRGLIAAVQWLRAQGGAGHRVNGHRDHKPTQCPGDAIYSWLQRADFDNPQEDDMPNPSDLWNHNLNEYDSDTERKEAPARVLLAQAHNRAGDARQRANQARKAAQRTERAVSALAKALGPEVQAAVEAALADAVVDVDVTVNDERES